MVHLLALFFAHSVKSVATAKRDNPRYRERVYKLVRKIPPGRVMTYGQIAEILGEGYTPRTVGFCMHSSPDGLPWHRVINAQGGCSTGPVVLPHNKQQLMLESEGVVFNRQNRCDLQTFLFIPKSRTRSTPQVILYRAKAKSDSSRKKR